MKLRMKSRGFIGEKFITNKGTEIVFDERFAGESTKIIDGRIFTVKEFKDGNKLYVMTYIELEKSHKYELEEFEVEEIPEELVPEVEPNLLDIEGNVNIPQESFYKNIKEMFTLESEEELILCIKSNDGKIYIPKGEHVQANVGFITCTDISDKNLSKYNRVNYFDESKGNVLCFGSRINIANNDIYSIRTFKKLDKKVVLEKKDMGAIYKVGSDTIIFENKEGILQQMSNINIGRLDIILIKIISTVPHNAEILYKMRKINKKTKGITDMLINDNIFGWIELL